MHSLGYIFPFPYTTWPKARYKKIHKLFTYYFCTITNLTKFDFPLPHDQTSRSRLWQMISENSSMGLSRLLWTMSDICRVSHGTRVVGKCLGNFFIPCFGSGYVWEWRNIPQTVSKKYTTFNTERIVALLSVNKIFPQSYDFEGITCLWRRSISIFMTYTFIYLISYDIHIFNYTGSISINEVLPYRYHLFQQKPGISR
jgi:hypothetical protein